MPDGQLKRLRAARNLLFLTRKRPVSGWTPLDIDLRHMIREIWKAWDKDQRKWLYRKFEENRRVY